MTEAAPLIEVRFVRFRLVHCSSRIGRFGLGAAIGSTLNLRPVLGDERKVLPFASFLDVDFLGDAQRIFELYAEVTDRAINLGVTQQKLNRTQVPGLAVNLRRLGASQ